MSEQEAPSEGVASEDEPRVVPGQEPPPQLRPGVRRQATIQAIGFLAAASVAAFVAALMVETRGQSAASKAVLIGHGLGHLLTLSWLVPTLWGFDRDSRTLLQATLGLSPIRIVTGVGLLVGAVAVFRLPEVPLVLAYVATHVWGHVVEHVTLRELAEGAKGA